MEAVKRYAAMKDSGIEWIGEIPVHWGIIPLKHCIKNIDSGVSVNAGNSEAIYPNYGVMKTSCVYGCMFRASENKDVNEEDIVRVRCPLRKHTVIISRMNTPEHVGACGYVTNDYDNLFLPDRLWLVSFNPLLDAKFAWRWLSSHNLRQHIGLLATGTSATMKNISQEQLANLPQVCPPLAEQQAIATYLDDKCSAIDDIIASARASIEDYKQLKASTIYEAVTKGLNPDVEMKDSGVEWIGKIPTHWGFIQLKRLTSKIGSGKTPSGGAETYSSQGILFLRSQNIYDEGLQLNGVSYISAEIDKSMSNTRVNFGDVLLNITGASIGRCCLFDIQGTPANVNQHVCIIRADTDVVLPEIIKHFLSSPCGSNTIDYYQTYGNRQGLNFEQIGCIQIPVPPIHEQHAIADYLDTRCAEIDSLIAEKEALIADLEAYKKSLIYECVTGKRRVTEDSHAA